MTTTLNALVAKVGSDVSGLRQGMKLARSDISRTNRIMNQAKTDAERAADGARSLEKSLAAGHITQQQYAKGMAHLADKYKKVADESEKTSLAMLQNVPIVGNLAGRLSALGSSATGSASAVAGLGVGAAAVAAPLAALVVTGTAVIAVVKAMQVGTSLALETIENTTPIVRQSRALNVLTGDLQRVAFGLETMAGIDVNQAADTMAELQQRIGEATAGTGEAIEGLQTLGLSAAQLSMMGPVQQFQAVTEALQNVENVSQRAYLADQMFGDGARQLGAILNDNTGKFNELQKQAEQYGLVLTQSQARQVESAQQSVSVLSSQVEGLKLQFSAELAPAIQVVAQNLSAIIPDGQTIRFFVADYVTNLTLAAGAAGDMANAMGGPLLIATGEVREGIEMIRRGFRGDFSKELTQQLEEARRQASRLAAEDAKRAGQQQPLLQANIALKERFDEQLASLKLQVVELRNGEAAARVLGYQQQGFNQEQIQQLENQQRIVEKLNAEVQAREKQAEAIKKSQELLKTVSAEFNAAMADNTPSRALVGRFNQLKTQFSQGLIDEAQFTSQVDNLRSVMDRAKEITAQNNPTAAVVEQLTELNVLLRVGAITEAAFFKERNKILSEGIKDGGKSSSPKAIEAGSQEAVNFITDRMNARQDQLINLQQKQVLETTTQTEVMRSVDRRLTEMGIFKRAR